MIYIIYAPSERHYAERLVNAVQEEYEIEFFLAPVGIEAGSHDWIRVVQSDIQKCAAAIVILSDLSIQDETVGLRFKIAYESELHILPVIFDKWLSLDSLHPVLEPLKRYNWILLQTANDKWANQIIESLSRIVQLHKKQKTPNCFFSYARQNAAFAEKLALDLRGVGATTWRDAENIPAGENWDREIEKAIRECNFVLFLATPASVASENVQDEIGLAVNKGKTVIPVIVETCELPLRVHRAQWVDFREDYESALKRLCEQLGLSS